MFTLILVEFISFISRQSSMNSVRNEFENLKMYKLNLVNKSFRIPVENRFVHSQRKILSMLTHLQYFQFFFPMNWNFSPKKCYVVKSIKLKLWYSLSAIFSEKSKDEKCYTKKKLISHSNIWFGNDVLSLFLISKEYIDRF